MSDSRLNTISDRELLDVDREAVVAQRDINRLTTELAAAKGVKAGVFRRAKKAGADMLAYGNIIKLRAMDVDDRNKLRETEERYAGVLGVVLYRVGTEAAPQGALWDEETTEAKAQHRDAVVYNDGWNSAKVGGELTDNPHAENPGSRDFATWVRGMNDFKQENGGKQVAVKASAAPKGRPAKPAKAEAAAKPKGKPGRPKKAAGDAAVH